MLHKFSILNPIAFNKYRNSHIFIEPLHLTFKPHNLKCHQTAKKKRKKICRYMSFSFQNTHAAQESSFRGNFWRFHVRRSLEVPVSGQREKLNLIGLFLLQIQFQDFKLELQCILDL